MKRLIAAAAALSICLAGAAHAQAPAGAPVIDAKRLDLARQVLQANGGEESYREGVSTMMSAMTQMLHKQLPPSQTALMDKVFGYMADEELKLAPDVIGDMAEVYAQNLTEQELTDLLAYAKTPSAQSIRRKMPSILKESIARQAPRIQAMMRPMTEKILDEVCAEQKCTADQRQMVAAVMDQVLKRQGS
jgi:hypothetical protein